MDFKIDTMYQSFILLIFTLLYTNCNGQKHYSPPAGVVDKTEEYKRDSTGWISLEEKERVDGYTRIGDAIFGGEIGCNIEPLEGIDISSFKVLPGTDYAKDKNHIYYPLQILCIDYTDCGVCYYEKYILENADPKTFEYLQNEYARDRNNVYFHGNRIEEADPETFRVVEGPEYFFFAKDSQSVYIHAKVFKEADPATFYYDAEDSRTQKNGPEERYIIGDKNNEWEFKPPHSVKKVPKR